MCRKMLVQKISLGAPSMCDASLSCAHWAGRLFDYAKADGRIRFTETDSFHRHENREMKRINLWPAFDLGHILSIRFIRFTWCASVSFSFGVWCVCEMKRNEMQAHPFALPARSGRSARSTVPACHISLSATAFNSFSSCAR